MVANRKKFEQWISSAPFEKSIERLPDNALWPGNYKDIEVDLAWFCWQEVAARAREEIKKLRAENARLEKENLRLKLTPKVFPLTEPFYEKHDLDYEDDFCDKS
jgi:hypothetical protein